MSAYERSAQLYYLVDDLRHTRDRLVKIADAAMMPDDQFIELEKTVDAIAHAISFLSVAALRAKREGQAVQALSEGNQLLDQLTESVELMGRKWHNITPFEGKKS